MRATTESRAVSCQALPRILEGLRKRGFGFITVSELIAERERMGWQLFWAGKAWAEITGERSQLLPNCFRHRGPVIYRRALVASAKTSDPMRSFGQRSLFSRAPLYSQSLEWPLERLCSDAHDS